MSARMRRLQADYERIKDEFAGHKYIKVMPIEGSPPARYLVSYCLAGLKWDRVQGRPVETFHHEVEIYLHKDYPREKPQFKMKTEIYHPNFSSRVCIADHWAAGECLADIIVQIGEMIQYRNYNPKSPLNQEAARWAMSNMELLPIGNVDLYQAEPEIVFGTQEDDDGLEIELF